MVVKAIKLGRIVKGIIFGQGLDADQVAPKSKFLRFMDFDAF